MIQDVWAPWRLAWWLALRNPIWWDAVGRLVFLYLALWWGWIPRE